MNDRATRKREHRPECRHFRGIQHATCLAGVEMEALPRPLPCLVFDQTKPCPTSCPKREWMTAEDHAARESEIRAAVARLRRLGEERKCHVCEKPVDPTKQIGRCLYAACGHRIGQVAPTGKGRKR